MSFLSRSSKTATSNCPRCTSHDQLTNTVQSLKDVLQHHAAAPVPVPARTEHRSSGLATAGIIGLAAMAGLAMYAARSPRVPPSIRPIEDFELHRYLGKWYELARIDHNFERGLQRTQAEYSLNPNGSIHVINRGFDPKRGEWRVSRGKATPIFKSSIAALKVSFFGPFYGGYNVVALDENYQWAMVIGSTLDYFWILSRQPSLPEGVEEDLMRQAHLLGVDIQKILWVHQDGVNPTGSYQ